MIIRKPYAFLIKNFKKIHIAALIIWVYVFYIVSKLSTFVAEFKRTGAYDSYNDPVTKYVNILSILAILLLIATAIALILLLRHKSKPWKLYLVPLVTYAGLLFVFLFTSSYFANYKGEIETANIRMIRDLLITFNIMQYPVFIIFLIRALGIDLKKFNFNQDAEYLELSNEDREELEININIDKYAFIRLYRKAIRNIGYFYKEHRFIINVILAVIAIIIIKDLYTFIFITNKSYKEGEILNANGYTIRVLETIYTDKDYKGDVISKKSAFVVAKVEIKNNWSTRNLNLNNFHVINGVKIFDYTNRTYATEFKDVGQTYEGVQKIKKDETLKVTLIFKVDKDLKPRRFNLYYQELDKNPPYSRKIKVKINDVSEIKKNKKLEIGDNLTITLKDKKNDMVVDSAEIVEESDYYYMLCNAENDCDQVTNTIHPKEGYKIIEIMFSSNDWEGKDMIDFLSDYGKINYMDSKNKEKSIKIKNAADRKYNGKFAYLLIPDEVAASERIDLDIIARNQEYIYRLT